MSKELSEVAFNQLIFFLSEYYSEIITYPKANDYDLSIQIIENRNTYSSYNPIEFEDLLNSIFNKFYVELETNINSPIFTSEFSLLNYLNNKIEKVSKYYKDSVLTDNEIYEILNFWEYYYDYKVENYSHLAIESEEHYLPNWLKEFRINYFINRVNSYINITISTILEYLKNYSNQFNIILIFDSQDEFDIYREIKESYDIIKKIINRPKYNPVIKNKLDLPISYYLLNFKDKFILEAVSIINKTNSKLNTEKIQNELKKIVNEINNSNFLKKEPNTKKFFNSEYLKEKGIEEIFNNDNPLQKLRETGLEYNLFICETKKDFDAIYKNKLSESELLKKDNNREDFIHIFKHEIVNKYYKNIKSLIVEFEQSEKIDIKNNTNNSTENLNQIKQTTKKEEKHEDNKDLENKEKPVPWPFECSRIFDNINFNKFVAFYEKYFNHKKKYAFFSALFIVLEDKKLFLEDKNLLPEGVDRPYFLKFLKEYSKDKLIFKQLKSKGYVSKKTVQIVLDFYNEK